MLIMPVGPPGAGKSTYYDFIVDEWCLDDVAYISLDQLRDQLLPGGRTNTTCRDTILEIARKATELRLYHNLDVYFDGTNILKSDRLALYDLAMQSDAHISILWFDITREEAYYRNCQRQNPVPEDGFNYYYDLYLSQGSYGMLYQEWFTYGFDLQTVPSDMSQW